MQYLRKVAWSLTLDLPFLIFSCIKAIAKQGKSMVFKGQDAWRRHPVVSNLWRNPFPGIQKAAAIYAIYLGLEYAYRFSTAPSKIKNHWKEWTNNLIIKKFSTCNEFTVKRKVAVLSCVRNLLLMLRALCVMSEKTCGRRLWTTWATRHSS